MNNLTQSVLPLVVLALLAGCASPQSQLTAAGPYVKPGLIMLTADQAQQRGIPVESATKKKEQVPLPGDLEQLDASAVTVPAGIKVYTVNRLQDPADPDLMHEEHVVYRRETTPQWRLDAASGDKIMVGPRVTAGQQDLRPIMDKELTTYLSDQRKATQQNQQAITALFQAIDALNRQQQALIRRDLKATVPGDSTAKAGDAGGATASDPNGNKAASGTDGHGEAKK